MAHSLRPYSPLWKGRYEAGLCIWELLASYVGRMEVRLDHKISRATFSGPVPPARVFLLHVPQPSKTPPQGLLAFPNNATKC